MSENSSALSLDSNIKFPEGSLSGWRGGGFRMWNLFNLSRSLNEPSRLFR